MTFKTSKSLLSKQDTSKFMKQADLACKLLDPDFLTEVVHNFKLEDLEDTPEFLEDAEEKLFSWREEKKGLQILEVENFDTRCVACIYGTKVTGYRIHYSIPGPEGTRIHYCREFALHFQLKDGCLTDFGWCNAFLDSEEITEIMD
ncbi:hypothetical protein [Salinimicrobium soli]|uniref:hypothetical protein n=1 Tax=Salinimicrobium soli TaxID=1254399 RepID=UPI003AB0336E